MARSTDREADGHRQLVLATVGTDHHRFDRLVRWVDAWARSAGPGIECFIQTGTSRSPEIASWEAYLSREQLQDLISRAVAVVCHGGPATIVDCRQAGVKPIVVPRRKRFDEHVDDHQLLYARRAAAAGHVELVETEDRLRTVLDAAVTNPGAHRIDPTRDRDLAATIRRFAAFADPLLGHTDHKSDPATATRSRAASGVFNRLRAR